VPEPLFARNRDKVGCQKHPLQKQLILQKKKKKKRQELVNLVSNFLAKAPKLFEWFKEFIGYKESPGTVKI